MKSVFLVSILISFVSQFTNAADFILDCSTPRKVSTGRECGLFGCAPNPDGSGTFCNKKMVAKDEDETPRKTLGDVSTAEFMDVLNQKATSNKQVLLALKNKNLNCCLGNESRCKDLVKKYDFGVYLVQFEDGYSQYISPYSSSPTTYNDREATEVSFFPGSFMSNLKNEKTIRKFYKKGGKLLFVGADGKEYPIKKVEKVNDYNEPFAANNSRSDCGCNLQRNHFVDAVTEPTESSFDPDSGSGRAQ